MKTLAALLTISLSGLVAPAAKAVSIYDASYDADGNISNTIVSLDPFIVVGLYNGNNAFITDGTGYYGRIYKSSIANYYTVGGLYSGVTVATQAYFGYSEFTSPTGGGLVSADNPFSRLVIDDLSTIASDVVLAGSPSAGTNFDLNFAPVSFTLTPTDTTTLSSTGTVTVADQSGKSVIFYKSALDSPLTAGQSYQIDGFVVGFNTALQIAGASVTPVPEPGTLSMLALGGSLLFVVLRRRRKGVA